MLGFVYIKAAQRRERVNHRVHFAFQGRGEVNVAVIRLGYASEEERLGQHLEARPRQAAAAA